MREAIGSSLLLNIVIVIIGVISAFLISSIAYSKAFKAKNKIISVIEEYNGDCNFKDNYGGDDCTKKIEEVLIDMGYSSNIRAECSDISSTIDGAKVETVFFGNGGHRYCVYKYELCDFIIVDGKKVCLDSSNKQIYYKVITYMHFDIPLIGSFLEFPVSGETKSIYDTLVNISS